MQGPKFKRQGLKRRKRLAEQALGTFCTQRTGSGPLASGPGSSVAPRWRAGGSQRGCGSHIQAGPARLPCYFIQILFASSGTNHDSQRQVNKESQSRPVKTRALWPESPPFTSRSLRPTPTGVSARAAPASKQPSVTTLCDQDRRPTGDRPDTLAPTTPPESPAYADRILRHKSWASAANRAPAHVIVQQLPF